MLHLSLFVHSHFALVSYNLIPAIFIVFSMDWVGKMESRTFLQQWRSKALRPFH